MEIRNNLLSYLKKKYIHDLLDYYDEREAEQMLTILIEHFFGIGRIESIIKSDYRLSESEILKLHTAFKDLKQYKPVQYITGKVEFHGLEMKVDSDVLIPRSETEEMVQLIANIETDPGLNILDIGTGSGCIAISLSSLLNNAEVYASDISIPAITIAKENAKLNNQQVMFHIHDILHNEEPILDSYGEKVMFDIIVSNPPYVMQKDKAKMHRNVTEYEPSKALFVSDDNPLEYYLSIIKFCEKNLVQGGRIYFEINEGLGKQVMSLLKNNNLLLVELKNDLRGKDRFVYAVKA